MAPRRLDVHTSSCCPPRLGAKRFDVSGRRVGSMPETRSPGYDAAEREAYRGVRRACSAGLDSTTLRVELTRRVRGLIPAEASYFGSVNRHTALLDDLVGEDASAGIEWGLVEASHSRTDAERA